MTQKRMMTRCLLERSWTRTPSKKRSSYRVEGGEHIVLATDEKGDEVNVVHVDHVDVEVGADVITTDVNTYGWTTSVRWRVTLWGMEPIA